MLKQLKEMKKTKIYRNLIASLSEDKSKNNKVWKEINALRESYGLTKYGFSNKVTKMKQHFGKQLDIHTVQKISESVWKAYEACFFRKGKKLHFKRYGEMRSLENRTNAGGIRFRNNNIEWFKLRIPVIIAQNNSYEANALENHRIKYNRIIRKYVGHKYRYYVQIVFEGIPPIKRNKSDGTFKHKLGSGDVGLDIGTSTIAVVSENKVKILELADKARPKEQIIRRLQRKLDRSCRATNKNNYNEDGTIKRGAKNWSFSNNYKKVAEKLKEQDTFHAKASQFNHIEETYKKKKLSQRWSIIGKYKVQRDMYSAFLIMNVNPDLKTFNREKCNNRFKCFYELHNKEVTRLQGNKNLSSIGI